MKLRTLKIERAKKDLSQADVAKKIGVSTSTYEKYENGKIDIPLSRALRLADVFSLTLDQLAHSEKV